ncbi:uncharacterized protein LOC121392119 [Gigantopelta aegis]|uniref:uncharacterized protein LOC121392119 n=1 Tax=Gigantopelta aegis TaxID=1735272 RepID=UPI001B8893EC|nr:uncharacterized protein LOC121392119 [Gigantopelta aegis]
MLEKAEEGNHLQKYLEDNDLLKKKSLFKNLDDATVELQNFPKLNMDQLRDITIGVYQLKQASSYSREHVDDNGEYAVMVCKESPTLIKVKIQSRHTSSAAHTLWIEYGDTPCKPVIGWYCTCKVGARVVGCCAHVASVLWYLGLWRNQDKNITETKYSLLDARDLPANDTSPETDRCQEE